MSQNEKVPQPKASYEKPAIVHSQKAEVRAVTCSQGTDQCGPTGPITS